jgi:hypothetical protein
VSRDFEKDKLPTAKDDLVVEYLEGVNQGIVVFGLNRPQVKLTLMLMSQLLWIITQY